MPLTFRPARSGMLTSQDRIQRSAADPAGREPAMAITAGDNGHRMANRGEGRPARDDVYERVAREFLRKYALDRDEVFAAAVARRFKEAPAKVCCGVIG